MGFSLGTKKIGWSGSAAPSGSITGAGTAGYVPLWTGANTIGNSIIYYDGTGIGINTAIPIATLSVVGNFSMQDGSQANGSKGN